MTSYRNQRLQEEIKRDISDIISKKVREPAISENVIVTSVELTKDLSYAKVFVSLGGNSELMESLEKASGFIRKELAQRMTTRITPELIFKEDSSLEYGAKIEKILADLKKESSEETEEEDNEDE